MSSDFAYGGNASVENDFPVWFNNRDKYTLWVGEFVAITRADIQKLVWCPDSASWFTDEFRELEYPLQLLMFEAGLGPYGTSRPMDKVSFADFHFLLTTSELQITVLSQSEAAFANPCSRFRRIPTGIFLDPLLAQMALEVCRPKPVDKYPLPSQT